MVLKLAFSMFRSGKHIETPRRGLRTNVWFWGILGQKVSWRNMADSESQPGEPVKKKGHFLPAWLKEYNGWKKKIKKCTAISVSQQVRETLLQLQAVTIFRSRPWKGTKILKITFWLLVTSSLEKAFKRQFQIQRTTSATKPWKLQGGTLFS